MSGECGRILLGDNTRDWKPCCGCSGSSVLEFGFHLASLVRVGMCTVDHMYTQLRLASGLPERDCCVRSGSVCTAIGAVNHNLANRDRKIRHMW
jgi:hypothetical protein